MLDSLCGLAVRVVSCELQRCVGVDDGAEELGRRAPEQFGSDVGVPSAVEFVVRALQERFGTVGFGPGESRNGFSGPGNQPEGVAGHLGGSFRRVAEIVEIAVAC